MKVIGTEDRGRKVLVLLDPEADTVEVITQDGVTDLESSDPELVAACYEESRVHGIGPVMLRVAEATDSPVGILVEHASTRGGRNVITRALGLGKSPLWFVEQLLRHVSYLPSANQRPLSNWPDTLGRGSESAFDPHSPFLPPLDRA